MTKITTIFLVFLCFSYTMQGQTKKYATTTPGVYALNPGVDVSTNASDGNLATKARITSDPVLNGRYLELRFPTTIPANTTSYVKIAMQDNQFAALIGGALGDLLKGLLGGLIGDQQIRVQAKKGNAPTDVVLDSQTAGFASDRLRIAMDDAGNYYVVVTPSVDYNRIRITNTVPLLSNPKWMDVYDAFYIENAAACGIGTYTSFSGTGLVTVIDTGVTSPQFAIDSNPANHSSLSLGVLGVASSVEQSVYFEGPSQSTDKYLVKLKLSPALITAGLLNNVQLIAHKNGSVVATQTVNSLLNLDLLGLLNQGQPVSVPFYPGEADRITVRMSGLLNVSLAQNLELYGIVRGGFGLELTGGGTCQVNDPMPLTVNVTGCSGPYTYSWEGVTDSDNVAMPSTAVPGTYTYVVTVTDKYGIQEKAATQITVEAPPVAGNAGGSQVICANTTPADISLTGHTGTIVRWEKSTTESFANPIALDNTTGILSSQQMGSLNETTWFRAVVKHNSYPEAYSQPAVMTVKKTVWDGTAWSNGVPDIETTIYFTGNYEAASDLFGCSLYVQNDANVVIPSGFDVTLYGSINVGSGSFTVKSQANLIQQTNVQNTGDIIVERNSSLLYRLDYTMWCSPVTGTKTLQEFSPATMSNRFYTYTTATDLFSAIAPTVPFELGKGYHIRMPNENPASGYNSGASPIYFKGIFKGVPNNGDVNIPLSHEGTGFSLVGNPYPSPINVHAFIDANAGSMDPSVALYFWRKKNNTNNTSYCTLTKMAYTSNAAEGGDSSHGVFTGDASQWVINPGQGFLVKAKTGGTDLVYRNTMRRGVNNNQFFRTAQPEQPVSRLWINITDSSDNFAQAAVGYTSIGTLGIDFGWDGRALTSHGKVMIYTTAEDTPLAVQARPEFTSSDVVPVAFRTDEPGVHKIALDHADGIFTQGQDIFLRDNVLGITHNIKDGAYEFTAEAGTFEGRFELIYAEVLGGNEIVPDVNTVIVYKQGAGININSGTTEMTAVEVYDMRGRLLYNAVVAGNETVVSGLSAENQVLIVNVTTNSGKVSKKIIF
ncbi:T9SS sorting signal type C domain-containing protein [uncultured Flavobacterium sp.]|uniref:T9SS sorting signal type C domain-containing protein n=1 Tax=uncultured Flavobacterium sp. TaxID=165435 RepID=UPI0025E7C8EF|nr:T9SS sorting signal type C domain-containing protein [uncultured Flavobacterium sp.]